MPLAYQGVQGGHAVAQFMIEHPGLWANETLVYVSVPDEEMLQSWCSKLLFRGFPTSTFFEPDLGGSMTALATSAPENRFSKLKLMGGA